MCCQGKKLNKKNKQQCNVIHLKDEYRDSFHYFLISRDLDTFQIGYLSRSSLNREKKRFRASKVLFMDSKYMASRKQKLIFPYSLF